ncbi:MAG: DUF2508 family protein [Lachnospiraceae bacterium]|nr:DUF2508 family protein [Lachnospiraceae bacterium]
MKVLFHEKRLQQIPVEEEFGCPSLQESMEKTRDALETAYAGFDNATDPELIDCYIYEINALLKKYTYLSQMAAKEHIPAPALNQRSPIRALISHVFG